MTMRIALLLFVVATVVAMAFAWRHSTSGAMRTATSAAAVAATVPEAGTPPAATLPAKQGAAPIAHPDASQPLSRAWPALSMLARGGDTAAMFDLAIRLRRCEDFDTRNARSFLAARQEELDTLERPDAPADARSRERAVALRDDIDMRLRTIAECEAVPEADRRSIAWLEAAARAGHHDARGAYLHYALDEFGIGAPDLIANIDEVIRRRDLARRFADEEIAACAPGAFASRMTAMDRTLGVLDPAQRLAAAHAAMLEARDDDEREVARTFVVEAAAQLDLAAREEARRRGEDAWRRCAGQR